MNSCSAIIRSMETNQISWQQKPRRDRERQRSHISPRLASLYRITLDLPSPRLSLSHPHRIAPDLPWAGGGSTRAAGHPPEGGSTRIRKTFEDCWATKSILLGYGVHIDECDPSLHDGFKDELHASLGCDGRLPQVFVDGEHLGGAEDVRRLHEAGELSEALEACEMALPTVGGKGAALEACSGCGGVRFVPGAATKIPWRARRAQSLISGTRGRHEQTTAVDESVRLISISFHFYVRFGSGRRTSGQQADTCVRLGHPVGPAFVSG
uniref:Putative glutaredoxin protein n=1 Tax=Hordeum vulgare subsp. vulgare TaxID=112509 RepID=B8K2B8_HORVV|nr:putative glutaredoxin protein [Hordeum vulgare subsp. vulgare]